MAWTLRRSCEAASQDPSVTLTTGTRMVMSAEVLDQTGLGAEAVMWRLDPRCSVKLEPSECPCLEVG